MPDLDEWKTRYGKVNEHNGWILLDTWLEEREKQAILASYEEYHLEGYRSPKWALPTT